MSNLEDVIDRYFAMWNEKDATRRRQIIAQTWTEAATYVDPLQSGDGRAGIDAMVQALQEQFPGLGLRRTSPIDAHNGRVRFAWELGPEGGPAVADGIDVAVIVDGRLASLVGFIDHAPAMAA